MVIKRHSILLFGDYTDPWIDALDGITLQAASSPWLQKFLDDVASIVLAEARQMDGPLRQSLTVGSTGVMFSSLADLADAHRGKTDDVGFVDAVMVYIVRAAALLGWARGNPEDLRAGPPEALGISGGLFNASALAVARNYDSLYEASLVVAGIVCRHCRLAWTWSREVENSRPEDCGAGGGAWGWTVTGISSDELDAVLVEFQETMGIPTHKRARVGIRGDRWSTVIGPPSILDMCFEQCPRLRTGVGKKPLAIHTLQHNPGWKYSREELDYIIGDSPLVEATPCSSFGLWGLQDLGRRHATWGSLLRDVVDSAFSHPVDVQGLVGMLASTLADSKAGGVGVGVMGPTCHEAYMINTLKDKAKQPLVVFHATPGGSRMVEEDQQQQQQQQQQDGLPRGRIAVIGMGGRGPDSSANDGLDQFWEIIREGRDVARKIPEERFNADGLFQTEAAGAGLSSSSSSSLCRSSTDYGCFLRDPGHFDSRYFRLSPREASLLDPCSRLFLMAACEAVEMSGYSDGRSRSVHPGRIGVVYGQSNEDGYMTTHHERGCDAYTLQTVQRAFAPGRVAHHFGWEGPTWSVDSACSTSSSILHLATGMLAAGEVDMVVAGASNVISSPHGWCALSKSGVLSATGNCKPFRDDADGYCRGEFVGAVVLKRLEDAVAQHDQVLAVIAATGKNQSGNAASITTPDAGAQERLFRRVLRTAGVAPTDISYVEAHGTGTPVGDPCEMTAIAGALARPGSKGKGKGKGKGMGMGKGIEEERLVVGAVKANIGHSEAASGIASLIKGVFMFRHQLVPPQAGMPHTLNPRLLPLLDQAGIVIPSSTRLGAFESAPGRPRRILINNVDAAGGNACFLLEDPAGVLPKRTTPPTALTTLTNITNITNPQDSPYHVVTVSARTEASFHKNKRRLVDWLETNPNVRLADLAYTTTARRTHHSPFRFACAASSIKDVVGSLVADMAATQTESAKACDTAVASRSTTPKARPVVWVFSGQGSEYPDMGRELYQTSPVFRDTVDRCVHLCANQGFPSFSDMMLSDGAGGKHDSSGVDRTVKKHLALVTLELALAAFWRHAGVEPSVVVGHSLGEYAALHVAGVLSLADVLHLVGNRARRLAAVCEPGACGMLAVSASAEAVGAFLHRRRGGLLSSCSIACINAPNAVVVSGTAADLLAAQEALGQEGIRSQRLAVDFGYHSAQMDAVTSDLERLTAAVSFSAPKLAVASTMLASVVKASDKMTINADYLALQTRRPVNFVGAVQAANASLGGTDKAIWLEMGPRAVCASLVRSILPVSGRASTLVLSTLNHHKQASGWCSVSSCLADMYANGVEIDWLRLYASRQGHHDLLVTLPLYAWDLEDYWVRWTEKKPSPEVAFYKTPGEESQMMHYTCAQHLDEKTPTHVTLRSRLAHPALKQIIDGHRVQGVPVCPGSVYCDAALAAAAHLLGDDDQSSKDKGLGLAIVDMNLIRPLTESLVGSDGELLIKATIQKSCIVSVSFKASPVGSSPRARQICLGTCTVARQDPVAVRAGWERNSYYIKSRIDAISQSAKSGRGHWVQPDLFYSLLSRTFEYHHECFKAVAEAHVAQDFGDAAARVVLSEAPRDTRFVSSPYWGEALVHLAGFLVNCRPGRPASSISIMHGIGRIEQLAALEAGGEYTTYARLCTSSGQESNCDVFVFDAAGDMILACLDMCFREMSTAVMAQALAYCDQDQGPVLAVSARGANEPPEASMPAAHKSLSNQATDNNPEPKREGKDKNVVNAIIQSIATETGCPVSRLTDDQNLADLGVDSIMAIQITSSVMAETGYDLAPSIFLECLTINHLRSLFSSSPDTKSPTPSEGGGDGSNDEAPGIFSPQTGCESGDLVDSWDRQTVQASPVEEAQAVQPQKSNLGNQMNDSSNSSSNSKKNRPKARVTLLRKSTKPSNNSTQATPRRLYLMADGFGSVSSYIHLVGHKFSADLYGIDSPYLRCPEQLTTEVRIQDVAGLMVDALLQHQPVGPFTLGGFSGGGILAYEMSCQLTAAGHEVQGLLVIDMRCPLPPPGDRLQLACSDRVVPPDIVQNLTNHTFALTSVCWNPDSDAARHLVRFLDAVGRYCPAAPASREERLDVPAAVLWCERGMVGHLARHPDLQARVVEHGIPLEPFPGFMQDAKLGHLLGSLLDKTPADLGPNGWDDYVGGVEKGREILCLSVAANHQEILQPAFARKTAEAIEKSLVFFLEHATKTM
ncbi:Type I Iterative PKS [Pyricularia oryzae]|nr:Type I Iterative PKS [Pyricularia oryzae]